MSAVVVQHPRSAIVFEPGAPWIAQASTPGIAAPKLWACPGCRVALVARSRPTCVGCGRRMEIAT